MSLEIIILMLLTFMLILSVICNAVFETSGCPSGVCRVSGHEQVYIGERQARSKNRGRRDCRGRQCEVKAGMKLRDVRMNINEYLTFSRDG